MIIGVPKETFAGERRVALVPAALPALVKTGQEILIEPGAGAQAGYPDTEYQDKKARLAADRSELYRSADVILQVRGYGTNREAGRADLDLLKRDQIVIGFQDPLLSADAVKELAGRGVMAFAMELLPRITRAQVMDALSSMATVAGYKAVLMAADRLPRMFPMLMTAAGTVAPARVFVVGAGVAGLQAIATAKRMGAVVQAYDVRPSVKDQVKSVGAKFVELALEASGAEGAGGYAKAMDEAFYQKQREMMARVVAECDVVITTAAIPGKKAPVLITTQMVEGMAPGSVIVDLAAENGGNCELTQPGQAVTAHGVTIIGAVNVASTVPYHASQMYAKNISTLLLNMITKEGKFQLKLEDEIVSGTLVTLGGEVVHPQIREILGLPKLERAQT